MALDCWEKKWILRTFQDASIEEAENPILLFILNWSHEKSRSGRPKYPLRGNTANFRYRRLQPERMMGWGRSSLKDAQMIAKKWGKRPWRFERPYLFYVSLKDFSTLVATAFAEGMRVNCPYLWIYNFGFHQTEVRNIWKSDCLSWACTWHFPVSVSLYSIATVYAEFTLYKVDKEYRFDCRCVGRGIEMLCEFYAIFYNGLDHLQIWGSMKNSGTNSSWITTDTVYISLYFIS